MSVIVLGDVLCSVGDLFYYFYVQVELRGGECNSGGLVLPLAHILI